jgi:hypothetical protein
MRRNAMKRRNPMPKGESSLENSRVFSITSNQLNATRQ